MPLSPLTPIELKISWSISTKLLFGLDLLGFSVIKPNLLFKEDKKQSNSIFHKLLNHKISYGLTSDSQTSLFTLENFLHTFLL